MSPMYEVYEQVSDAIPRSLAYPLKAHNLSGAQQCAAHSLHRLTTNAGHKHMLSSKIGEPAKCWKHDAGSNQSAKGPLHG